MKYQEKRNQIKFILNRLHDRNRYLFLLMYAAEGETDIDQVVDQMPDVKVPWALTQCERSYYGLFNQIKNSTDNANA